jgi:hypothetical protein
MNDTDLPSIEHQKSIVAYRMCELFAEAHELPTDYVYMEFVDPQVASLKTVTEALDVNALLVYN